MEALPCKHSFHKDCLMKLRRSGVNSLCPTCRADLPQDEAESLFVKSVTAMVRHETEKSEALLRQVLDIAPRHFEALHNLGCIMNEKRIDEQSSQAEPLIRRALDVNPEHVYSLTTLASWLLFDDPEGTGAAEAAELIERALAIEPDDSHALYHKAVILANDKPDEAEELLRRALVQDPTDSDIIIMLVGMMKRKEGTMSRKRLKAWTTEKIGHLRTAVAHNPADVLALKALAALLFETVMEDPFDARLRREVEKLYRMIILLRPDDVSAHFNLATTMMVPYADEDSEHGVRGVPTPVANQIVDILKVVYHL